MRSDTLLTLNEFAKWIGMNPWFMAQIQPYSGTQLDESTRCAVVEYPWQRHPIANDASAAGNDSRQGIADAIRKAEQFFRQYTKRNAAPKQEMCILPIKRTMRGMQTVFHPRIQDVLTWGREVYTQAEAGAAITRTNVDGLLETFTIGPVSVPDDTDDVVVCLPGTEPMRANLIRPVTVTIDDSGGSGAWTATISGPAYLFVNPALYEADPPQVLSHHIDTYLESADVYTRTVDGCDQGAFLIRDYGCGGLPCPDMKEQPVCWRPDGTGYSPQAGTCTDGVFATSVCYDTPEKVKMVYVGGIAQQDGLMNPVARDAIAMLTIAFLECVPEVACNACATQKYRYYSELSRHKQRHVVYEGGGESAHEYELLANANQIAELAGLEPRRGFLNALALMRREGWFTDSSYI